MKKSQVIVLVLALFFKVSIIYAENLGSNNHEQLNSVKDEFIRSTLVGAFMVNHVLSPFEIDITVKDQQVLLEGVVDSKIERELAEKIALNMFYVNKVDNNLLVGNNFKLNVEHEAFSYKINDLNISAEVQYRILWNKKICSKDIIIKTTNGVVNLDGTVRTATEKKLAKVIACNTRSVRQVVNTLKIENDESNASKYFPVNSEKLQVYSDQKITTVLYKNTLLDKLLRELDLSFATKHGVVTVKGTIKNQQQHAYILDMVQSTPGIEAIKDLLTSK
jgi:osmotically-inducible protein OsmY